MRLVLQAPLPLGKLATVQGLGQGTLTDNLQLAPRVSPLAAACTCRTAPQAPSWLPARPPCFAGGGGGGGSWIGCLGVPEPARSPGQVAWGGLQQLDYAGRARRLPIRRGWTLRDGPSR